MSTYTLTITGIKPAKEITPYEFRRDNGRFFTEEERKQRAIALLSEHVPVFRAEEIVNSIPFIIKVPFNEREGIVKFFRDIDSIFYRRLTKK